MTVPTVFEDCVQQFLDSLIQMPHLLPALESSTDAAAQEAVRRYKAQMASQPMVAPWANTGVPDQAILDRLFAKTKGQLFLQSQGAGFLGSLMCSHRYAWDEDSYTAWCNGVSIGFNPQFFMWLSAPARVTVLAHELLHTFFDHMGRCGDRCPDLWNQAADHVINLLLVSWGFDFTHVEEIKPCKDPRFFNMTTEAIYEILIQEAPPSAGLVGVPDDKGIANGPGKGMPTPDPSRPLHGDVRPIPNADAAVTVKATQVKAIQAAIMAKEAGMLPGEITLTIEEFLNPILPWDQLLARFFTALSQDDYSWKRPSRRYENEYLPSPDGDNQLEHLAYYIDVSGSVTDAQVLRFFSEVKHIHAVHQPKLISIVSFDDGIQNEISIAWDEPFEKIEITGRGGTELEPVREHIVKHKPTAAVVFSDLWCAPMKSDPQVPLIWVVIGNQKAQVPFGKKVHIDA